MVGLGSDNYSLSNCHTLFFTRTVLIITINDCIITNNIIITTAITVQPMSTMLARASESSKWQASWKGRSEAPRGETLSLSNMQNNNYLDSRQGHNAKATDCHALFRILRFFELGCFLGRNIDLGGSFPTHDLKFGQFCNSTKNFGRPKFCWNFAVFSEKNYAISRNFPWPAVAIRQIPHLLLGRAGGWWLLCQTGKISNLFSDNNCNWTTYLGCWCIFITYETF